MITIGKKAHESLKKAPDEELVAFHSLLAKCEKDAAKSFSPYLTEQLLLVEKEQERRAKLVAKANTPVNKKLVEVVAGDIFLSEFSTEMIASLLRAVADPPANFYSGTARQLNLNANPNGKFNLSVIVNGYSNQKSYPYTLFGLTLDHLFTRYREEMHKRQLKPLKPDATQLALAAQIQRLLLIGNYTGVYASWHFISDHRGKVRFDKTTRSIELDSYGTKKGIASQQKKVVDLFQNMIDEQVILTKKQLASAAKSSQGSSS